MVYQLRYNRSVVDLRLSFKEVILMLEIFTRGAKKGLNLTWELVIKIVLPVYIIVSLLTYTPVIHGYQIPCLLL
jgi:hypothetical protein